MSRSNSATGCGQVENPRPKCPKIIHQSVFGTLGTLVSNSRGYAREKSPPVPSPSPANVIESKTPVPSVLDTKPPGSILVRSGLNISPETLAAATAYQRKHPPTFTPEQERLLCAFSASRPREERLAIHQRAAYLHAVIGWDWPTCDLASYLRAWEAAGSPVGPFTLE